MLVVFNFFVFVSIISAQFLVFCLKNLLKRKILIILYRNLGGTAEEPYGRLLTKEEDLHTARESISEEVPKPLEKTQSSIEIFELNTAISTRVTLVPTRTEEQRNQDEKQLLKAAKQAKKRRNDSSTLDDCSWPEDEDTLYGVNSLLTDNATSLVPRSITARPSNSSLIQLE